MSLPPDWLRRAARAEGLVYLEAEALNVTRRRAGRGFSYYDGEGNRIADAGERKRLRALAIPPAWSEVRIAAVPEGHLQAIGRDEDKRRQYRYHDRWEAVRELAKLERLARLGRSLHGIRRTAACDLRRRGHGRRRAAAVAVTMIDAALLRAGHETYARDDGGRGVATLLSDDVAVGDRHIRLDFKGKGGKAFERELRRPRLAKVLRRMKRLEGERLLQYRDAAGELKALTATQINAYLQRVSGRPVTAKDFRTFAASAAALERLASIERPDSDAARRRVVAGVVREIAGRLNNTPAVARASYITPAVIRRFDENRLSATLFRGPHRRGLSAAETALMRLLEETMPD